MPCMSKQFDPAIGPIIDLGIAAAGSLRQDQTSGANVQVTNFHALIDSGATVTCITSALAQGAGLRPVGKAPVSGSTGASPMNTYLVDFLLHFGNVSYVVSNMTVIEFSGGPSQYAGLLGRDIICKGLFAIHWDGRFYFCL